MLGISIRTKAILTEMHNKRFYAGLLKITQFDNDCNTATDALLAIFNAGSYVTSPSDVPIF